MSRCFSHSWVADLEGSSLRRGSQQSAAAVQFAPPWLLAAKPPQMWAGA
jgi:hypothetical protein